jgi:hypothetical protein
MGFSKIFKDNYYIIWDADTLMLNKIEFTDDDDRMILFYKEVNEHIPYLYLIDKLFRDVDNFQMIHDKSFVVEKMLINKHYMLEFINYIEYQIQSPGNFFEKILSIIDNETLKFSGFSEFSTYAHFLINFKGDEIVFEKASHFRFGNYYLEKNPTLTDIQWVSKSYDSISFEEWDNRILTPFQKYIKNQKFIPFDVFVRIFPLTYKSILRFHNPTFKALKKIHDRLIMIYLVFLKRLANVRRFLTSNFDPLHRLYISFSYMSSLAAFKLSRQNSTTILKDSFVSLEIPVNIINNSISKGLNEDYFRFVRFFKKKWRIYGFVLGGDWDLSKFDFKQSCTYIDFKKKVVRDQDYNKVRFCQGLVYENTYFWSKEKWINRYNNIIYEGYKGYLARGELPTDEVEVAITRDGEICFIDGGHRLSIAKELGLPNIPVILNLVHKEFIQIIIKSNKYKKITPVEVFEFALEFNSTSHRTF